MPRIAKFGISWQPTTIAHGHVMFPSSTSLYFRDCHYLLNDGCFDLLKCLCRSCSVLLQKTRLTLGFLGLKSVAAANSTMYNGPEVTLELSNVEASIKAILDDFLSVYSEGKFSSADIARQWTAEIASSAKYDSQEKAYAADQYTVTLHPDHYPILSGTDIEFQVKVSVALKNSLNDSELALSRDPHVTLATDPTLESWEVRVIAWHSSDPGRLSAQLSQEDEEEVTGRPPPGAFFIIDGSRHFPLKTPLVTIGRRLDNQLVLEDPHVSRKHAQLKARGGRYRLYDLDSTVGTRVNGNTVDECVLQPGDVITIATVQLIYGEDVGGPPEVTPPYSPPFRPDDDRDQVTPLDLTTIENSPPKTKQLTDD
jgi:hypothetical protein